MLRRSCFTTQKDIELESLLGERVAMKLLIPNLIIRALPRWPTPFDSYSHIAICTAAEDIKGLFV